MMAWRICVCWLWLSAVFGEDYCTVAAAAGACLAETQWMHRVEWTPLRPPHPPLRVRGTIMAQTRFCAGGISIMTLACSCCILTLSSCSGSAFKGWAAGCRSPLWLGFSRAKRSVCELMAELNVFHLIDLFVFYNINECAELGLF